MYHFYYAVPASAVFTEIDGNSYALVLVKLCAKSLSFVPCSPRILRVSGGKVFLGKIEDKIAPLSNLPDCISFEYHPNPVTLRVL